jgi:nucleoside-diphosphate-sugar epimerase
MMTLVVGATGATGRHLVEQLLNRNQSVRAIVRSPQKLGDVILKNPNLTVIEANVLDLSDREMADHVKNCDAVVSCLGHVLDFNGMFGNPRKLCTEATQRLCNAIEKTGHAGRAKFILMNTVGVPNSECDKKRSWHDRALLGLLHYALPPHRDNETASEYLSTYIGKSHSDIDWCCVRPDSLVNKEFSPYEIVESPTTGIFTGRPTSRVNVAHFMADLIQNDVLWNTWKNRMPVIMNSIEKL